MATGLAKNYGAFAALKDVNFTLRSGETVAVVGENGAGKSTLSKILAGVVRADAGQIVFKGESLSLSGPRDALRKGIAFIPQDLAYVPEMTVAENILLGRWPARSGVTSARAIRRRAAAEVESFGLPVPLGERMSTLKLADRQLVEILKALVGKSRVIILDEPTAALSAVESDALFEALRRLAGGGVGLVFISHRIDEVNRVADRVDILRNGRLVASLPAEEATRPRIIAHMLGELREKVPDVRDAAARVTPVLAVRNLRVAVNREVSVEGLNLTLHAGEILGLFGVRGSGLELIAEAFGGRRKDAHGTVVCKDNEYRMFRSPAAARAAGVAYVPPERTREGLVPMLSVQANLGLLVLRQLSRFGVVRRRAERKLAFAIRQELDIRARSLNQRVATLSGGNQQKVLLGSRLAARPRVIVLHEPTRGVDVGARVEIQRLLRRLADDGGALLLATVDAEEAVAVSDRLCVIRDGVVVKELVGHEKTQEAALLAAAGAE